MIFEMTIVAKNHEVRIIGVFLAHNLPGRLIHAAGVFDGLH